jgi:hypothetical protein
MTRIDVQHPEPTCIDTQEIKMGPILRLVERIARADRKSLLCYTLMAGGLGWILSAWWWGRLIVLIFILGGAFLLAGLALWGLWIIQRET